jgi:predicted ATPase/DNA-binding CsgD family transcriptional regulator
MLTEFPAGVWLVDLAPLTDAGLVPATVARALGLDSPCRSTMAAVTGFLRERRALVVLDNCEHLLDACALLVEELLRACPDLVILATSREPIGAAGEATWLVPPLQLAGEAVELLADRARQARPGFAVTAENGKAVAEICRRLDGIPLAIELAAARLRAFSPAEIAAGLHDRLLTGSPRTAVCRQQTLRASLDWSHALLTDPERTVFRRLAVFAGGFDLAAGQAVTTGDGMDHHQVLDQLALLVDKSMVAAEESHGATRYRLLETVRQFAAEKLSESGDADAVRVRHRDYYTELATRLDRPMVGDASSQILRLEADIANLRAAFQCSLELSDNAAALRLASSLQPLWLGRSHMLEGLAWFDAALASLPAALPVPPEVRARALADTAVLNKCTDGPHEMALAGEAVALARQLGDPILLGRALTAAGCPAGYILEDWRPYLDEAVEIARSANDPCTLAQILGWQSFAAGVSGDLVAARSAAKEGLALAEQTGNDLIARQCRTWLGCALAWQGDLHAARSLISDLVAEAGANRDRFWEMYGLAALGSTLARMGHPDEARAAGEASIAIADDLGLIVHAGTGYGCLAVAAMAAGDIGALREANQALWQRIGFRNELGNIPQSYYFAEADLAAGDLAAARRHADNAIAGARKQGKKHQLMWALLASARVASAEGDVGLAHDDAYQALTTGHDAESQTGIIDALECLGRLVRGAEDQQKAARLLGAANALRQQTGYRRFLLHQAGHEAAIAALRSSMGDAAFAQAWDEGAALTCADAVTYAMRGRGARNRPPIGWLSLTPAESDVARLVAEGMSNKDIAGRLFVSPRTVQTHLTHMFGKLGITSRVQLAHQAAHHASDSSTTASLTHSR